MPSSSFVQINTIFALRVDKAFIIVLSHFKTVVPVSERSKSPNVHIVSVQMEGGITVVLS